ncbi:MAG: type VI secretion system tip protein VgrG [Planctomycetaceae bacterium]|nr:type VI secretion system tip protein VgrG [Planctomycetaceae bacterium]
MLTLQTPFAKSLELTSCLGSETLSEAYFYAIHAVSQESSLEIDKVLGKDVSLSIDLPDGKAKRHIAGICTRFEQGRTKQRGTEYVLEIRPRFWLLTLKSNCAVYQKKTVLDIVGEVLKKENVKYQDKTSGSFPKLEYVVQYNETDFDFVSRLLEEAGVFYYFTHTESEATLVLGNKPDIFADAPQAASLPYIYENYSLTPKNEVRDVTLSKQSVPLKVSLNDYNFETPTTKLLATKGEKTLEQYAYPGGYTEKSRGETLADQRLQAALASEMLLTATTSASGLAPGFRFKITGHPRSDINAAWVVRSMKTDVSQELPPTGGAGQAQYRTEIEAIPAKIAPLPLRKTPKPRTFGPIPALVVGKSGEEIETDKHGRVKVQFYWDREGKNDENSSCWVRVAQSWAGTNYGIVFLPRIDQEVLVNFEGGDPDRPIITGVVYNDKNKPPYEMPGNATRSVIRTRSSKQGSAGNEISFEDKKDAEELYLHAQKNMRVEIENARTTEIKEADDKLTLKKGNRTVELEKGNETRKIKGNVDCNIDGNETRKIKGNVDLTIDGNETRKIKGNANWTVEGNLTLTVKGNLTIKADGSLTLESGTAASMKSGTAMTLKSGTGLKADAGTTLNLEGTAGFTLKSSAHGTVDGGGMLTVKGGMVKIN